MIDWKKMINDHNKEFNGKCLDDPNHIMLRVKQKNMIVISKKQKQIKRTAEEPFLKPKIRENWKFHSAELWSKCPYRVYISCGQKQNA